MDRLMKSSNMQLSTIKTNEHKTCNKFCNLIPPLIRLIVVCFWFPLAPQRPTTHLTLFECSCAVYCCVWERDQSSTASIRPPNSEQYCWTVDCCIPRSPHTLSISHRINSKGCGANYFIGPPSQFPAHRVQKSSSNPPSPHRCAAAEAISLATR